MAAGAVRYRNRAAPVCEGCGRMLETETRERRSTHVWTGGRRLPAAGAGASSPVEWGKALRLYVANWRLFLPGVPAFLLCELMPVAAQGFMMVLLASAVPLTAAGCAHGYVDGTLREAVRRGPGHLFMLLLGAAALAVAALPGVVLTSMVYLAHHEIDVPLLDLVFWLTTAPPMAYACIRLWPVWTVSFTGAPREFRTMRCGVGMGPGLVTVCRLTAVEGAFRRFSKPMFTATTVLLGSFALAYLCVRPWPGAAFLLRLGLYGVVVPLWCLCAVGIGGALHAQWRAPHVASGADGEPLDD